MFVHRWDAWGMGASEQLWSLGRTFWRMFARKTSLVREMGIHVAGCVKGAFGVQEVVSVMSLK